MSNLHRKAFSAALEWYVDQDIAETIAHDPVDHTKIKVAAAVPKSKTPPPAQPSIADQIRQSQAAPAAQTQNFLGRADAYAEALRLAKAANTLEELKAAIESFDGLAIKKTATNMVFCDGNPEASVMLVGEAPGADEDRLGKPFVGASGQLLDRILKCIDLERGADNPARAVYISNILNWRPPGNRTPSPAEIEVSLPFIEKHIALIKPKILILCGGVSAKALLGRNEGISRLRKTGHEYRPLTAGLDPAALAPITAIPTYHPAYLLRTPSQKKAVWADMLTIRDLLDQ